MSPVHQYATTSTTRILQLGEEKVRVTGCISVNANDQLLPCMFIMKHNTTTVKPTTETTKLGIGRAKILTARRDMKAMVAQPYDGNELRKRVISDLHKKEGYREQDGWALRIWKKYLCRILQRTSQE